MLIGLLFISFVVIEGMAAGNPVVATAAGGVLDIIEHGVNGLLVPCKDAEAMAQAISWLLSNREEAEQIGRAARQRVVQKFTVSHHVAAVQSVYDAILDIAQSPDPVPAILPLGRGHREISSASGCKDEREGN